MKRTGIKIAVILLLAFLLPVFSGTDTKAAAAPDWSDDACYGSGNPLTAGYKNQCTWYVWGRVRECLGIRMSGLKNRFVDSSVTGGYTFSPSAGAVAVYTNDQGSILHVAYIEAFDGSSITYSEGNNISLGRGEQKYYTRTMSLGEFAATTKSWVGGCTILKYIPLTKQDTGEVPVVTVYTGTADNITETNAKLHGSVSKPAGTLISYCGIYLGTDMNHMIKQNTEAVGSSANNKDNGTGFDIWYDLGSELSVTLSRGTLYYYQVYVICGGREFKGEIKSFETRAGTVIYDQDVRILVPANVKVQGYQTATSDVHYRKIDPMKEPYTLYATRYAVFDNGSRRFYFTDGQGNGIWIDDSAQYAVTYCVSSLTAGDSEVTVPVGESVAVRFSCNPSGYTEALGAYSQPACPAVIEGNRLVIRGEEPVRNAEVRLSATVSGKSASVWVNVVDSSAPEIGNIAIRDVDASGFTVSWEAEDNYRLDPQSTKVLAWNAREDEAQAGIAEITGTREESPKKACYEARIRTADHGGAAGEYLIRIQAGDTSKNLYTVGDSVTVPCGHALWERRNKREAGCTAEGYTGDMVCVLCKELLKTGEAVPAAGHTWDSGQMLSEGQKIFTCMVCGEKRTERIPDTGDKAPAPGEVYQDEGFSYTVSAYSGGTGEAELSAVSDRSISSVRIPKTVQYKNTVFKVTSIGEKAFKNCKKLKTITIGEHITDIGAEAFRGCVSLTSLKGGSGLKEIGVRAFYGCSSLDKVNLASAKLVRIGDSAFAKCTSLSSFRAVSSNLSYIGKKAFQGDAKLGFITLKTAKLKTSRVGAKAFQGIGRRCRIKVPAKCVKAYRKMFRAKGAGKQIRIMKG